MTNGSLFFLHWAHYLISVNSLLFHNHKIFPEVPSNSTSLVRSMGILSLLASPDNRVLTVSLLSTHRGPLGLGGDSHCSFHAKQGSVPSSAPNSRWENGPWFSVSPGALPGGQDVCPVALGSLKSPDFCHLSFPSHRASSLRPCSENSQSWRSPQVTSYSLVQHPNRKMLT